MQSCAMQVPGQRIETGCAAYFRSFFFMLGTYISLKVTLIFLMGETTFGPKYLGVSVP